MTKDWVHGVGHSPVCQILLQIIVDICGILLWLVDMTAVKERERERERETERERERERERENMHVAKQTDGPGLPII